MKKLKEAVEESSDQEVLSAKKQVIVHMQQVTDKYNKLDIHLLLTVCYNGAHFNYIRNLCHSLANFLATLYNHVVLK